MYKCEKNIASICVIIIKETFLFWFGIGLSKTIIQNNIVEWFFFQYKKNFKLT